jgi:hypothetical protein
MSSSFIGSFMVTPYFSRYEDALNLAALHHDDERRRAQRRDAAEATPVNPADQPKKPYTLVCSGNVGYTGILLFARDPDRLSEVQVAELGFGAMDMGNKGAVGLRTTFSASPGGPETELTFVATHLAAMEWNLARRNANWAAIMRGLTFENPETVLTKFRKSAAAAASVVDGGEDDEEHEGERTRLLQDEQRELEEQHVRLQRSLHDLSVFKPSSHLFVAGDLNYRISTVSPKPGSTFPSLDPNSPKHYSSFLPLDQLTRERRAGRTLHGLSEAEVKFPPTYKLDIKPVGKGDGDDVGDEVEWSFAPHRYPAWTDRVLYLEVPPWVKDDKTASGKACQINVLAYDAMPVLRSSDHRAVYLRAKVPLIAPEALAPPKQLLDEEQSGEGAHRSRAQVDPRLRLPIEIDPEAWDRRQSARRREIALGCSSFLWTTKQGALILSTLAAAAVGVYWLSQASRA